ncbi:MAG: GAF domain-containing protein [Anaerolineae bacterium]|nr:GAF domain-containing protein [Anaerolineae bacterium]
MVLKNLQLLRKEYYETCYYIRETYKRLRVELLPKLDRTLFEVGERDLLIEKIDDISAILRPLRESQIEDWQREHQQSFATTDPSLQWRQISYLKLVRLNELKTALSALIEVLRPLQEKIANPEHQREFNAHLETLEERLQQLIQLKAQGWDDTPTTEGINSWVGIGLRHGGKEIGLIVLDHYTPDHYGRFGENLITHLDEFSIYLSEYLENALRDRNYRLFTKITRMISECVDDDTLAQTLLDQVRDNLKCDNCTFFRVESLTGSPRASENQGEDRRILVKWLNAKGVENTNRRTFGSGKGIAGYVLQTGESYIVPHAISDPIFDPTPHLDGVKMSMLVIPVRLMDQKDNFRTIGVISCYKKDKTDFFTPYDRDLVEQIADQVAGLIERTTILNSTYEINGQINLIVSDTDKSDHQLARICAQICEYSVQITGATDGVIHLLEQSIKNDQSDTPYRYLKSYVHPKDNEHSKPRLTPNTMTYHLITEKAGEVVQFSESNNNYSLLPEAVTTKKVRFVLGICLQVKNNDGSEKVIGVISVNQYGPQPFSNVARFMLKLFASQAAIAINNHQQVNKVDLWSDANEQLRDAIAEISKTDDPKLMYLEIVKRAAILTRADYSYLALTTPNTTELHFEAVWPERELAPLTALINIFDYAQGHAKLKTADGKDQAKGVTGLAAAKRQTILIDDIHEERKNNSECGNHYIDFKKNKVRSELAVPILDETKNSVIGVINLESEQAYAFTPIHVEIIEHLAKHVAIAWQKNQWIAEIDSEKQKLIRLQSTLDKIATLEAEQLLPLSTTLLAKELNAFNVLVILITQTLEGKLDIEEKNMFANQVLFSTNKSEIRDNKFTQEVFLTRTPRHVTNEHQGVDREKFRDILMGGVQSAVCVPMRVDQGCIGVIWFQFKEEREKFDEDEVAMYQVVANQLALLHTIANRRDRYETYFKERKQTINTESEHHYIHLRWLSYLYTLLSIATLGAGIVLGTASMIALALASLQISLISGVLALASFGVSIRLFEITRDTNRRADGYYREIYDLHQLEMLLMSTQELGDHHQDAIRNEILSRAAATMFSGNTKLERRDQPK